MYIIFEQRVVIKFDYDSGLMIESVQFLLANAMVLGVLANAEKQHKITIAKHENPLTCE